MFIKIKELELRKIVFDENIPPGIIDLGEDIEQKTPVTVSGRAELIREHRGSHEVVEDIRLVGKFATQVKVRCARCLEPVGESVAEDFDLLYRPMGVDAMSDESAISLADTEIGYYQGEGLLLEDVLKEQLLLALPVKQICSAECKGLCPHCGVNLNVESCDCVQIVSDPRWAALEDIRKKLER
ncbi:MAG: DNA-binding protein [Candidatus Angelobacter sp. Gp1-AA117]|nr:MAG: DNA-binding protein [Candidatus Angelobacter sp. Gp1-AA117]